MNSFDPEATVKRLTKAFTEIIAETPHGKGGGASLSLWQDEKCLLSLVGGEASPSIPWNRETPCLIWSASKGVSAAMTLRVLQKWGISLETPVAALWPEFAAGGKERITLAELLSHRAGLAALEAKGLAITDHEGVAAVLAAQAPNWESDGSHGYGARTFGFLLDEIIRRITGASLAASWEKNFRQPLGLDLWFGLPEERLDQAATIIAPRTPPSPSPFTKAFGDPASLTRRALSEPGGSLTPSMMNTAALRRASIPSLGVITTADALARFYALLAGSNSLFTQETRALMQNTLTCGLDRVLLTETSFSAGFMTNATGVYGPSKLAFGHPGAGGSLGFADPELGLGFAFIPSAMHPGSLPGPRTQKLVRALYGIEESD